MSATAFGWRAYGLGAIALGVACLASADFVVAQPLPQGFAHREALAFATAALLIVAGAAVEWRRATACGATAIAVFYAIVLLWMDVPATVANRAVYGIYSSVAEQVAMLAGAVIVYAASARIDATRADRLTRWSRRAFGVCALLFGGAHFVYMGLTTPLVPKFLPPSQAFWAIATGLAHIAAGLAILVGVRARLAAILLTAMYAAFTPLVHLPLLLADPANHANWAENAINLALTGVAWVVADSFGPTKR